MTEDLTRNDTEGADGQLADGGSGGESQGFTGAEGFEQLAEGSEQLVGRPAPGDSVEISAEPGQTYVLDFDPSQARALVEGDNLILVFEDGGQIVFENLVNLAQLEDGPSIQYADMDIIALLQAQGIIPGVFDSFELIQPEPGQIILIQSELGQRFVINFDPAIAQISVDGDNLVMTFPDGGQIVIAGLGSLADKPDVPLFSIAGAEIPGSTLLGTAAATSGGESGPDSSATLETAAGGDEPVGTGATQYSDDTGDIIDTIGAQGVIPPTALEFDVPDPDPTDPIDLPNPPVAFSSSVSAGEGELIGIIGPNGVPRPLGFVYKFDVGEENDISDNIHGIDEEDGVTTAFTITSLPEFGVLVVDLGDDGTLDAVYGVSNTFIPAAAALPPGGIEIGSDDVVYYFLPIEQVFANEADGGLGGDATSSADTIVGSISVQFDYFTTDSSGLSSAESTLGVTFNAMPVVSATDGEVDEAALSDGSNPGSPNETDTGTFTINTFGDTLATVTVGGVDVTGGGVVNGTYGDLTVTETAGAYSWSYTLSDNTLDHPEPGSGTAEGISDEFSVTVTDSDGDVSVEDTLKVEVLDDGPSAVADTTTTSEDTQVTYNVITNTDSTSDSSGADAPATLTAASLASGSATVDGFNANGEITVTPAAGYAGTIVVNYTIIDADGDISDATLTITVGADSTPTVSLTDGEVDESALVPDGSGGGSVTDSGSFTINTFGDTLAKVEVLDKDGVWHDVTLGGPVTGVYGTLVVTETDGSYTWVYTLGGATADHTGIDLVGSADQVPDDFSVRVTDSDNDLSPTDAFVIQINDDGPSVEVTHTNEAGVVLATQDAQTIGVASDTDTSTADFSGVFGVTKDGGADGEQGTVVTYALALLGGFTEGDPSGLEIGGVAINLYETGGLIFGSTAGTEGAVNAGNTVFEISVSASGVVTLTQHQQIDHDTVEGAPAYDDDQQFLADGRVGLTATAVITDGDGDTESDSETVDLGGNLRFDDDGPSPVTADKAFVANSGDAVGSGDLNFLGNVGADQPGDIQFDSALSGTMLARSGGGAAITSGEEAIFLNVSGDGHTLTALADTDGNFGTTGDQTTVFTIVLDPLADDYTIDFDATLDDGAGFVLDDFSAAPAGQNEWIGLDTDLYTNGVLDPLGTPVDIEFDNNDSQDLLITWIKPGNNPGTVNTSSSDLGNDNQWIDGGEGLRFDLVQDISRLGALDEADAAGWDHEGHLPITDFGFKFIQMSGGTGPSVVRIAAYSDPDTGGDVVVGDGSVVSLDGSLVTVWNGETDVTGSVTITDEGDTVVIEGIMEGWNVAFTSVTEFNSVDVTNIDGEGTYSGADFGLGAFSFNIATAGDPIDMDFALIVSDEDGDTAAGTLAVTTVPDGGSVIVGTGADETLIGGTTDDTLTGNGGSDNLTGGAGVDTFIFAAGDGGATVALADLISDFEDGTDLIGLTGGLTFGDLTIDQSSDVVGDGTNDTVISVTAGGEILAILDGITTTIDGSDIAIV